MTSTPDLLSVALSYHQGGDLQTAERLYRQLLATNESHAEAAYLLGSVCQSQNRPAEAEEWLRRATELRPDYPEALNNLGVVLAQAGQCDEAIEHLRRAVTLRPQATEMRENLAGVLKKWGDLDAAAAEYRTLLQFAPQDAPAHNRLASALAIAGRLAEATAHFQEAVRLQPRYTAAHSNLLLALNYAPDVDPLWLFAEHCFWDRLHGGPRVIGNPTSPHRQPLSHKWERGVNEFDLNRRLRVGYLSPGFRAQAEKEQKRGRESF